MSKVTRAAVNGRGTNSVAECIRRREPFKASAMSGRFAIDSLETGRLSSFYADQLRQAVAVYGDRLFVIYSYETPIAWAAPTGEVSKVGERFSVTTSKHSGRIPDVIPSLIE